MLLDLLLQLDRVSSQSVQLRLFVVSTGVERLGRWLPFVHVRGGVPYSSFRAKHGLCLVLVERRSAPSVIHVGHSASEGFLGRPSGPVVACRDPFVSQRVRAHLEERLCSRRQFEGKDVRSRPVVTWGRQNLCYTMQQSDFIDQVCVRLDIRFHPD